MHEGAIPNNRGKNERPYQFRDVSGQRTADKVVISAVSQRYHEKKNPFDSNVFNGNGTD